MPINGFFLEMMAGFIQAWQKRVGGLGCVHAKAFALDGG